MNADFDVNALHGALDGQRRARGLSWAQLGRQLGINPSTLSGMCRRRSLEGDGVLQVLRWLERDPESFLTGFKGSPRSMRLPIVSAGGVLRFDARAIYEALELRRKEQGLTWRNVAEAIRLPPSSLTSLKRGGRVGFPHIMRIFTWLGQPAAGFVRLLAR